MTSHQLKAIILHLFRSGSYIMYMQIKHFVWILFHNT